MEASSQTEVRRGTCPVCGLTCQVQVDVCDGVAEKIKKDAGELTLRLVRNPDILAGVAALSTGPFTVGFAAETDDVLEELGVRPTS